MGGLPAAGPSPPALRSSSWEGLLKAVDASGVIFRAGHFGTIECFDRCVRQHPLMKDGGYRRPLLDLEFAARRPRHEKALLHAGGTVDFKG